MIIVLQQLYQLEILILLLLHNILLFLLLLRVYLCNNNIMDLSKIIFYNKIKLIYIKNNFGYSLIELMIVMTIIALLMGVGSISFFNVRKQQNIKNVTNEIESGLYMARSAAILGEKTGCDSADSLDSVDFSLTNEGYNITLNCGDGVLLKSFNFSFDGTIVNGDIPVSFAPLTGDVGSDHSITINYGELSKSITIASYGRITVN